VSKFKQQSAITSKRYEIGCPLLLVINRKLHTVFRLVSACVTLNDLERRIILLYFTEFDNFAGLLGHSMDANFMQDILRTKSCNTLFGKIHTETFYWHFTKM